MNRAPLFSFLLSAILFLSGSAVAQLSASDISALQERAKVERWTFTVGETTATKRPLNELCGLRVPPNWQASARFVKPQPRLGFPTSYDWRALGGCTAIKDQDGCGSCWAFGTVGPLESAILIKDGIEVDLAEQWLVSCNQSGWGCNGGFWAHDYHLAAGTPGVLTDPCGESGAVLESDFPYQALDLTCNCPYSHAYTLTSWAYISSSEIPTVDEIKGAIVANGPVSVAVHVGGAFQGYTGGVFNACENGSINHAVVLVGWDDSMGTSGVWILRNSWSTGWGDQGYMYIEYGCSSVGYAACFVDYPGSDDLAVTPGTSMSSSGTVGGPFDPSSRMYALTNNGTGSLDWQVTKTESWVDLSSPTSGTLAPSATANVTVSINSAANALAGGTYMDTVSFTNVTSGHGQTRHVALRITPPAFYSEPLDADPGWTAQGAWAFGVPQGDCGDPTSGHTGANVYGYNLSGCYTNYMAETFLTTAPIDCSAYTGVILQFWRRLGVESSWFDHARVQASNNGTDWTDIWAHDGGSFEDPAWVLCEYDISAIADMQPTVYVRWGMGPTDYSETFGGWNIDDVQLLGNYIDDLTVMPAVGTEFSGYEGGPFTPDSGAYTLTNVGGAPLTWSASEALSWLDISPSSGTLAPSESVEFDASLNTAANALAPGTYSGTISFTNPDSGLVQNRAVSLNVLPYPGEIVVTDSVAPADDLALPFGTVIIGLSSTEQITVTNTDGTHGLIVSEISLGGGSAAYSEDFNDGLAQGWEPDNPAQWAVVSEEYRAQAGGLDYFMTSVYTHGNWDDLAVQVTMRRTGSEPPSAMLTARTTQDFDLLNGVGSAYAVCISGDGFYLVFKLVNGSFESLQDWSPSPYLNTGAVANTVLMSISGSDIDMYFNDNLAWSGSDSSITAPGSIGLGGYSGYDAESIHYFDDVIVGEPLTAAPPLSEPQAWFNAHPIAGRFTSSPKAPAPEYPGGDVSYLRAPGPHLLAATLELLNVPALPYTVNPGASFTLDVRYAPTAEGADAGSVIIGSNDSDEPEVEVAVSGQGLMPPLCSIYSEPLDTDPGWTTEGAWAYGVPSGNCGDPASGYTGTNVYGYNLEGCYANDLPAYALTTAAIDCSGQNGVRLRFWRWLGVESSAYDQAAVQVSNNGTDWVNVWTHNGGTLIDTSWVQCEFDISAVADGQSTVYIRWVLGPTDFSVTYAGWNIDDVELLGICTDDLWVYPGAGFESSGLVGGPFTPVSKSYTLQNSGGVAVDWSAAVNVSWLDFSASTGTLAPSESIAVDVSLNANAEALSSGDYAGTITFTNTNSGVSQERNADLEVVSPPGNIAVSDSVSPGDDRAVSFGRLVLGSHRTEQITVHNTDSAGDLIISDIALGGGPAFYTEDFNEGLAQDWLATYPSDWAVVSGEYRAQAGMLYALMQSAYTGADWADLSVQATLRRTGSESAAGILFARASADFDLEGWGSAYLVGVDATGSYFVAACVNGTLFFLQDWTYSPYLNTGATANDVLLSLSGTALKVSFNGTLAWSGTDSSVSGPGRIGLGGFSGIDVEAVHYFDNVIVGAPLAKASLPDVQAWYNAHPYSGGDLRHGPVGWKPPAYADSEALPPTGAPPLRAAVFELGNVPTLPQTVGPGGSFTFDVSYTPNAAQTHEASVTITSNDQDEPEVQVVMTGEGYGGELISFYSESLNSDPGWTGKAAGWEFGVPQGGCGDPASGHTGVNVYGYDLSDCYPNNLSPTEFLTTSPIDCTGYAQVRLRFWRWLGVESSMWDHASVEVSNDGANWTLVWANSGPSMSDAAWVQQEYNIAAVADNQPTVYVRWGMGPTDGSVTYGGWNIDDIELLGNGSGAPRAAFIASPAWGRPPLLVTFTDRSTPGGAAIADWAWNFGDGTSAYEQDPTHLYEDSGIYTVSLTVTSPLGSDTLTMGNLILVSEDMPAAGIVGLAVLAAAFAMAGRLMFPKRH